MRYTKPELLVVDQALDAIRGPKGMNWDLDDGVNFYTVSAAYEVDE